MYEMQFMPWGVVRRLSPVGAIDAISPVHSDRSHVQVMTSQSVQRHRRDTDDM